MFRQSKSRKESTFGQRKSINKRLENILELGGTIGTTRSVHGIAKRTWWRVAEGKTETDEDQP